MELKPLGPERWLAAWVIRILGFIVSGFLGAMAVDIIRTSDPYSNSAFVGAWMAGFGSFVVAFWALIYADHHMKP